MASIQETVGANIRRFRQKKGFSQEKLAVRSGLSAEYICRVENAQKDIKASTIQKIAKALDIEPHVLLQEPPKK